jgi:hypothetical protein
MGTHLGLCYAVPASVHPGLPEFLIHKRKRVFPRVSSIKKITDHTNGIDGHLW